MPIRIPEVNLQHDGISLSADAPPRASLIADANINQSRPRDFYVYAHRDSQGRIFYVGRGSARRAWSTDRDELWYRYVDIHLKGTYSVQILADGLSDSDAEALEGRWMDQESDGLVNRQNMSRGIDLQALNRRDALMKRQASLMTEARSLEASNLPGAIDRYLEALSLLKEFSIISFERGLFAQLSSERDAEQGPVGQIRLLDRLTLCLVKAGRAQQARERAAEYFAFFKNDRTLKAAQAILHRVERNR